jgi:hypothetical protein
VRVESAVVRGRPRSTAGSAASAPGTWARTEKEFADRAGLPGELLVRVTPEHVVAKVNLAD